MNQFLAASSRAFQWSSAVASSRAARRVPRGGVPSVVILVAGAIIVLNYGLLYTGSVFVLSACYAIVTAGMAVQIGFSQQIAFSQSVFFGAGAYGVAILNSHLHMSVLLSGVVMVVAAGLIALLLGSVVTRASGLALAVATLMLPLIAVGYVSGTNFLGGPVGSPLNGTLWPGGGSTTLIALGGGLIVVVVLAAVVFIASRILSSDIGLELFVLGVDERTAAALGVRTPRRKLELFVLGCVCAALGGVVYAGTQQFVPETVIDPQTELALLIMLFIGGRRSPIGAVIGALVIQYLQGASNWVSVNILIVEGVLLTVVLLVDPEGISGIFQSGIARLRGKAGAATVSTELTVAALTGAKLTGAELAPADLAAVAADAGQEAPEVAGLGARDVTLLEVRGVFKEYGGLSVLHDVSLALPGRGLFALCGPNGAGKTTLLNVIGGSVAPSSGEVILSGTDITRRPPNERFYQGISRTFQAVHLIKGRTVLDNVAVACLASHTASIVTRIGRSRLDAARAKAARTLADLGMAHLAGREVSSLTLETQRMVELARALASSPRLLLLDEPASGLSEEQRQRLAALLVTLAERACVLLVEHDLALVAQVSERIFVLSGGRLVFDGGPADFRSSPVVNSLLVGS
jgi:branched-chain amino acid transport system permease protein